MHSLAEQIAGLSPEQRARLAARLREKSDKNAIPRRSDRHRPVPLSAAQYGLWLTDQSSASANLFNVSVLIRFAGELATAPLHRALDALALRHEALRTCIELVDGVPMQRVLSNVAFTIPVTRLAQTADQSIEASLLPLAQRQDRQAFCLAQAPLLRVALVIVGEEPAPIASVLVATFHHIICDAWSKNILIGELVDLYAAFRDGRAHRLPSAPGQYPDYAVWEQQSLIDGLLRDDLLYWQSRLANAPPPQSLPTDLPHAAIKTGNGAALNFALNQSAEAEFRHFCRTHGITLFMGLLGVLAVLMKHYGAADRLLIGTDAANRQSRDSESMVGFFINQLALPITLAGNPGFRELIRHIRSVVIEAYAHQRAPFSKVVDAVKPTRFAAKAPLFETKLVLENTPKTAVDPAGSKLGFFEVPSDSAEYDTLWLFIETEHGLEGRIQYAADKYTPGLVAHYADQYANVLQRVCEDPDIRLSDISAGLSRADERRRQMAAQQRRENKRLSLRGAQRQRVGSRWTPNLKM